MSYFKISILFLAALFSEYGVAEDKFLCVHEHDFKKNHFGIYEPTVYLAEGSKYLYLGGLRLFVWPKKRESISYNYLVQLDNERCVVSTRYGFNVELVRYTKVYDQEDKSLLVGKWAYSSCDVATQRYEFGSDGRFYEMLDIYEEGVSNYVGDYEVRKGLVRERLSIVDGENKIPKTEYREYFTDPSRTRLLGFYKDYNMPRKERLDDGFWLIRCES